MLPNLSRGLSLLVVLAAVSPAAAQEPADAVAASPTPTDFGANVLSGLSPARRTLAGFPATLPGRPDKRAYRVRVTATCLEDGGDLELWVKAGGECLRLEATAVDGARGPSRV